MWAAATTMAGLSGGEELERGCMRCRITLAGALTLAPQGSSEAALPTWLNLTPATPKIASGIIHPWPTLRCWPAQAQTAPGLVLSGQTPGSQPWLCPGLALFGNAAIARGSEPLGGALLPQQGDKQNQSLPCYGVLMSGTTTLSTSIVFCRFTPRHR